jgi:hypothetical protein
MFNEGASLLRALHYTATEYLEKKIKMIFEEGTVFCILGSN